MYVNETFKKDLGSFTIQDVFMDGVSWVWKQDSYGYMKASAYIKATGNHQAESWLVSPVMNFKKSKEPELLFEHACRFRAENPADHLNVMGIRRLFGGCEDRHMDGFDSRELVGCYRLDIRKQQNRPERLQRTASYHRFQICQHQ